ncbi:ogr/Delta-like zinc finger family protein [Providencia alcalifaciens]|uniref:ogr/Delta-like zinc finger family protein n=1 Tax=Providencia alcalifaciens TaxID=126385 RepID=UPI003D9896F8
MSKNKLKLRHYQQPEVWNVRVLKIFCPECNQKAIIRKSNRKHRELSDLYCACSDVECGHTFVLNLTFSHTISPSAKSNELIQSMIGNLNPEQRQLALGLLTSITA